MLLHLGFGLSSCFWILVSGKLSRCFYTIGVRFCVRGASEHRILSTSCFQFGKHPGSSGKKYFGLFFFEFFALCAVSVYGVQTIRI